MKIKVLCTLASPFVKWAAKEVSQNPFLKEYIKARMFGASGQEAFRRAKFHTEGGGKCPHCGAVKPTAPKPDRPREMVN